jgi:hypothetical protein
MPQKPDLQAFVIGKVKETLPGRQFCFKICRLQQL